MESEVHIIPAVPVLTLTFKSKVEAKDLYDELRKWNSGDPRGIVLKFFEGLEEIIFGGD